MPRPRVPDTVKKLDALDRAMTHVMNTRQTLRWLADRLRDAGLPEQIERLAKINTHLDAIDVVIRDRNREALQQFREQQKS